jgi:lysozyme family protein
MADFKLLIDHTIKWEGGASADPRDKGLIYGNSGVLGKDGGDLKHPNNFIHTNKGILWGTYVSYCKVKGKTPSPKEFIEMPKAIWLDIYKTLFWDKIFGDQIKSQAIAEIIMEAIWGGGSIGMVKELQRFLNKNGASPKLLEDGAMGFNTYTALNNYAKTKANEMKIVDLLTKQRLAYLQSLSDWSWAGQGWSNRVNELYARASELVKKGAASNTGKVVIGAIILGSLAFLFSDKISTFWKKGVKVLK